MSTILVIQPYRMLQHAFAMALPFEHKVRVIETLPDAGALKDVDAVIIDTMSLVEKTGLSARDLRAVESWNLPTIWVENTGGAQAPSRDRLVTLAPPLRRDVLQRALAACLDLTAGKNSPAMSLLAKTMAQPAARENRKAKKPSSGAATPRIIELVEIVEEATAEGNISTREK